MNDLGREVALDVCDAISRAMFGGCEFQYLTPDHQRSVQRAAEAATEVIVNAYEERRDAWMSLQAPSGDRGVA